MSQRMDAELFEIWEALPAEEDVPENEIIIIELSDCLEADERIATVEGCRGAAV